MSLKAGRDDTPPAGGQGWMTGLTARPTASGARRLPSQTNKSKAQTRPVMDTRKIQSWQRSSDNALSPTGSPVPLLRTITLMSKDERSGSPACAAMLASWSTQGQFSLRSFVASLQDLSDADVRWFFGAKGYGFFLVTLSDSNIPYTEIAAAWQSILTRVFADEEAAEQLWLTWRDSLISHLLQKPATAFALQEDIKHLALTSGLRPQAIAELARDMPSLQGTCGDVLIAMAYAYDGDPGSVRVILGALCVVLELAVNALKTHVSRLNEKMRLRLASGCLSLLAPHYTAHPSLWRSDEDASNIAVLSLSLLPLLAFVEVSVPSFSALLRDILNREDDFSTRFALQFLKEPEFVLFGHYLQMLLSPNDGVFALALEHMLVAVVVAGYHEDKKLDLFACAGALHGQSGTLSGVQQTLFNAELFMKLVAIHFKVLPFEPPTNPTQLPIVAMRRIVEEQVSAASIQRFMTVPRLVKLGAQHMLSVLDSGDDLLIELMLKLVAGQGRVSPYKIYNNEKKESAFLDAVKGSKWHLVDLILRFGGDIKHADPVIQYMTMPMMMRRSYNKLTPLMVLLGTAESPLSTLELAIARGADVNAIANEGVRPQSQSIAVEVTTLHYAATHSVEAVQLILQHAPNLITISEGGGSSSPLARACTAIKLDVVRLFLAQGARVNDVCPLSKVPTILALADIPIDRAADRRALLELLIAHGADINVSYRDENTQAFVSLLRRAIEQSDVQFVRDLLDRGASVAGPDTCNTSLVQLEVTPTFALLLAHGWNFDTPVYLETQIVKVTPGGTIEVLNDVEKAFYCARGLYASNAEVFNALYPPVTETLESVLARMPPSAHAIVAPHTMSWSVQSGSRAAAASFIYRGLCIAEIYMEWTGTNKMVVNAPRAFASVRGRLVPHHYTPLAFRRASRALALLRMKAHAGISSGNASDSGNHDTLEIISFSLWAELPLELFEAVLDELFLLERAARGELS